MSETGVKRLNPGLMELRIQDRESGLRRIIPTASLSISLLGDLDFGAFRTALRASL